MTKGEFAEVIGFLELAIGKPIHPDRSLALERTRLYYGLLKDLPLPALRLAAERLVAERKWASFPQVAELRDLAVDSARGEVQQLSATEAWAIANRAVGRCDLDIPGSVERAFAGVPPLVKLAVDQFGFHALYNPGGNLEAARAQFLRVYDALADRERRTLLLPASVRGALAAVKSPKAGALPPQAAAKIARIGVLPKE